jgi:O-methyltransferase
MLVTVAQTVRQALNKSGLDLSKHYPSPIDPSFPRDFSREKIDTILKVKQYTMTSKERLFALCDAVSYVVKHQIGGDIVECGVWKGGSMMAVADTLLKLNDTSRELYLFDTFEGMSEPTEQDRDFTGESANSLLAKQKLDESSAMWCYSPLEKVQESVLGVGYPSNKVHFVKGKVEETLPYEGLGKIAILRLDTDWYESTKHELIHLFPLIAPGGVLIIDDYGWWEGARQAVDEYIAEHQIKIFLNRIDSTGRLGIVG